MNSFPSDCSCLMEMLTSVYKATAVLCPTEKYIKILSFDSDCDFIEKKLQPYEFISTLGNFTEDEKMRFFAFLEGFLNTVPTKNTLKKLCFTVEENHGIFVRYTATVNSSAANMKHFLTVSKSEQTLETITLMFKKNSVDVKLSDIIYVDYGNHSVEVHTTSGKLSFFSVRFGDAAARLLENQNFLRSYKNCIVNMDRIVSYDEDSFIMENDVRISIPKRRKKEILKVYNDYLFIK